MKLLLLTEYFPDAVITGGVEARAQQIATLSKKFPITVICSRQPGQERVSTKGNLTVKRVGWEVSYSSKGNILRRLVFAMSAFFAAMKEDFDIIEGFSFLTYIPAALAGLLKRKKRIATYHETWVGGDWIRYKGPITGVLGEIWERLALNLAWTKVISVSNFTAEKLEKVGISKNIIEVIPNGVDMQLYAGKARKYEAPTIICIARLVKTKNISTLIRALPSVRKAVPRARCMLIGVGSEEESLKQAAENLGVVDMIDFKGKVSDEERALSLKKSHVFCLPSKVEGFGITVIEAMAASLPCALSDIPPFREIASSALFFPADDYQECARQLIKILDDRKIAVDMSKASLENARLYDWKKLLKRVEGLYNGL